MSQSLPTLLQKFKLHLLPLVVGLFFFAFHTSVFAADLSLTPSTGTYAAGQTFTTVVKVAPNGDNVNAVESTLKFDPKALSVVSVSKDGSVFSLWTTEPTFSNANGTVSFGGGSPTPFSNTSNILTITFRTVAQGAGSVTFSNASVLAADGRGTDVYKNSTGGNYTITGAATPTPTPTPPPSSVTPTPNTDEDEAIIFGDPPRPPEVGSQTFLDPDVWYNKTEGVFTWTLPFDITAVAVEIASDSDNKPEENEDAVLDPPVEEFAVSSELLKEGVQYVSVNFQNQVGWGAVTNRKLQIDTQPPQPFAISVRAGTTPNSFPLIVFEAKDLTSGIEYYDMTVANKEPIHITPDEARLGYLLKELEDGTYTVKVVATDKAGNVREGSTAVLITAGWVKPVEVVEEVSLFDFLTPTNLFIAFLIVIILLQIVYYWYEHKQLREKEEKLRRETREIQDQMEKIFSALRDEIYDQVNTITKRKRLSKNEKQAVEGLAQALEVSETLIEKEINDVKSILK
ncbi:MAG: cohesin domain-containing protein [Patescibacteria group bacterium]